MDYLPISADRRPLGQSSLLSFPIAYGCWKLMLLDRKTVRKNIETALEIGINFFDHADIYGGEGSVEEHFGKVLAEAPELRRRMLIATKCGIVPGAPYDSSYEHIICSANDSLKRLGVDIIDLYQLHRPDLLAHPEPVATALVQLRTEGKIREAGVSNHTPSQFEALQACLPFQLATHQSEFSALTIAPIRNGVLDQCLPRRVTPLAYSPLAGGRIGLTLDEARKEENGERLAAIIEKLDAIAEREGVPRAAVALAFILVHPAGAIPIIGTLKAERIRDCAQALRVRLSRADWYAILEASQGYPHS